VRFVLAVVKVAKRDVTAVRSLHISMIVKKLNGKTRVHTLQLAKPRTTRRKCEALTCDYVIAGIVRKSLGHADILMRNT